MDIKAYFLNQCSTTKLANLKNSLKIMIVNPKVMHESKTMLGVIGNLVFDFILYFVNTYMRKCPIHVTSAQCTTQTHYTSLE